MLAAAAVAITACNRKPVVRIRHVADRHAARHTRQWLQHRIPLCHDRQCRKIGSAGGHRKGEYRIFLSSWRSSPVRHARPRTRPSCRSLRRSYCPKECRRAWAPTKSPSKAKAPCRTRSLPTRSPGGVSRAGRTACTASNTIPIRSQTDTNSLADLFTAPQLLGMEKLLREKLYAQYGTDNDGVAGRTGLLPGIHRPDGKFPDHSRRHHLLLQPLRDRMLCTRGRRSGDRPRGAGAVLTSGRDAAPAYPGSRPYIPGTRTRDNKKAGVSRLRPFSFCREPPPSKMRYNRRYSTFGRAPPFES